jgi:hypothetical protein
MNRYVAIVLATMATVAVAETASAQVCAGGGSFSNSPVHLSGDLTVAESSSGLHLVLGFGGRVPFGGVAVASTKIEGIDDNARALVFFGGAELGGGRVFVCPIGDFELMEGPNVGATEISGYGFAGGARAGFIAREGSVRIIPTIGYFQAREERTPSINGIDQTTLVEKFGLLQYGIGFVGRRVAFGPTIVTPIGLEGVGSQLRLGVGIMF